jgi:hypothetical protein
MKFSECRIEARDRRLAAVHEAGHVAMAKHIGLSAPSAQLRRVPNADFLLEKRWVGSTSYLPPHLLGKDLSELEWIMLAVSGAVAEFCWERREFDEWDWCDPDTMSASDWALSGCKPGVPTERFMEVTEKVFGLIDRDTGVLWPPLLKEARRLVEESR